MEEKKGIIAEFRAFITRGNVMDMAVGVIIGSAFTAIVNSLVNDILMPIIGGITGGLDFTAYVAHIGSASINYGTFIQAIVNFLLIAVVIFLIVKLFNKIDEKSKAAQGALNAKLAAEYAKTKGGKEAAAKLAAAKAEAEKAAAEKEAKEAAEKAAKEAEAKAAVANAAEANAEMLALLRDIRDSLKR